MSTSGLWRSVETVGAEAVRRWRLGAAEPLLGALLDLHAPARVLVVGSMAGAALARLRERAPRLEQLLIVDPDAASLGRTRAGLTESSTTVALHHARLLGAPAAAPHFTRVPALVDALRADPFDLILVTPPPDAGALYALLSQVVPLLAPAGVVCVTLAGHPEGAEVVRRVALECAGPALLWQPADTGALAALLTPRVLRHNHEEARSWCAVELAADPLVAAAVAGGDHAAICAALRHWLAGRLVWSTRDLLLPLAELPPSLSVRDVVELCARGEGGVWGYGAAVTLAMLYRACGYPATVYQHGIGELFWHMVTLVQVPDGRILVEDAFFDAELRLGGRPVDWSEALTVIHAGRVDLLRFDSELGDERPHLYSRAGLAAAEADGFVTPVERRTLEAAMEGCRRLVGEPRVVLRQPVTASFARFVRIPAHARALAAVHARTGIGEPLALLGLPCGALPLSGDARLDGDVVRVLDAWDRLARALVPPVAAAVGA